MPGASKGVVDPCRNNILWMHLPAALAAAGLADSGCALAARITRKLPWERRTLRRGSL